MDSVPALAEHSMVSDLQTMAIISHNLANVNTPGYKRDFSVPTPFDVYLNQHGGTHILSINERSHMGIPTAAVDRSAGGMRYTGQPLDVAIEGIGFIEVHTTSGSQYTRNGSLTVDALGRLSTKGGHVVKGVSGDITLSTAAPSIDNEGRIWDGDSVVGQIAIKAPAAGAVINKVGGGMYDISSVSSVNVAADGGGIKQGFVETSNVNNMSEMVKMIETVRHFELNQKLMKGYDEMINQSIRTIGQF